MPKKEKTILETLNENEKNKTYRIGDQVDITVLNRTLTIGLHKEGVEAERISQMVGIPIETVKIVTRKIERY